MPRVEIDFQELARAQNDSLGEVDSVEHELAEGDVTLPPQGAISLSASGLETQRRHVRQLRKLTTANRLAYGVLGIFGATVILLVIWALWISVQGQATDTASLSGVLEFGKFILPYQVTALGVTLGFYFAGRSEE